MLFARLIAVTYCTIIGIVHLVQCKYSMMVLALIIPDSVNVWSFKSKFDTAYILILDTTKKKKWSHSWFSNVSL